MRVRLKKDVLVDDQMYGIGSIVDLHDEGRTKFFLDMNYVEKVSDTEELTKKAPPPKPLRSQSANELAEAITDAIRHSRTFEVDEPSVVKKARAE
jgi:hypothetical protein